VYYVRSNSCMFGEKFWTSETIKNIYGNLSFLFTSFHRTGNFWGKH
jgi:hypothetical protein